MAKNKNKQKKQRPNKKQPQKEAKTEKMASSTDVVLVLAPTEVKKRIDKAVELGHEMVMSGTIIDAHTREETESWKCELCSRPLIEGNKRPDSADLNKCSGTKKTEGEMALEIRSNAADFKWHRMRKGLHNGKVFYQCELCGATVEELGKGEADNDYCHVVDN